MKFPKPWFRNGRGWFVTLDGRQIKLADNREEALSRYQELMATPKRREAPRESLLKIIDAFLDWCHHHRAPKTYEWYRFRLERFARAIPSLAANQLRPFHVQRWLDSMAVTSSTKHSYGRSVKRCLRWAKQQGYIDLNPIADFELPRCGKREQIVTEAEWQAILSNVTDEPFRDLLVTTWETGCRPQESLRVEARHVDLQHQRWVFPPSESKTHIPRIVYLTNRAFEITRKLASHRSTGKLFRNANDNPWTKDSVNCRFTRLQTKLGMAAMRANAESESEVEAGEASAAEVNRLLITLNPNKRSGAPKTAAELRREARKKLNSKRARELGTKYSLYALRHTWMNRLLKQGVDALTVAFLAGHTNPGTLAKVYAHLSQDPEYLLEQVRRIAT